MFFESSLVVFSFFSRRRRRRRTDMREPSVRDAYILSWISLALTLVAFVVGVAIAAVTQSAAMLAFGLENLVDCFSSILVLWRFWGGGVGEDSASEQELETREKRASVGIAFSFLLLAVIVGGIASAHLSAEEAPDSLKLLVALSVPCVVIFGALGVLKFHMGRKLDSPSLKKDGICSGAGAFISAGTALGGIMLLSGADSWWFDSTVAVLVCTFLFMYACWTLTRNAIKKDAVTGTWAPEKWWTLEWWTSPGKPRTKQDDDDSTSFGIKMSARDGLQNSSEVANPEAGL